MNVAPFTTYDADPSISEAVTSAATAEKLSVSLPEPPSNSPHVAFGEMWKRSVPSPPNSASTPVNRISPVDEPRTSPRPSPVSDQFHGPLLAALSSFN